MFQLGKNVLLFFKMNVEFLPNPYVSTSRIFSFMSLTYFNTLICFAF